MTPPRKSPVTAMAMKRRRAEIRQAGQEALECRAQAALSRRAEQVQAAELLGRVADRWELEVSRRVEAAEPQAAAAILVSAGHREAAVTRPAQAATAATRRVRRASGTAAHQRSSVFRAIPLRTIPP